MKILVLQHERVEHPGFFRQLLNEDGHQWTVVHVNEGESLPSIDDFDALWVMGGPMDVWQETDYPWLIQEKQFIRAAVQEKGKPYFGLCLGHQLLAEALGGQCAASKVPEIGVLDVQLTEAGVTTVMLDDLPDVFPALQWHSAEVIKMPENSICLATSPACAVQAMNWGPRAYSVQFHLEIEPDTVDTWSKIPAYAEALKKELGENGINILARECREHMQTFQQLAERVYINWLQTAARVT